MSEELVGKVIKKAFLENVEGEDEIIICFEDSQFIAFSSTDDIYIRQSDLPVSTQCKIGIMDHDADYKRYLQLKERFE